MQIKTNCYFCIIYTTIINLSGLELYPKDYIVYWFFSYNSRKVIILLVLVHFLNVFFNIQTSGEIEYPTRWPFSPQGSDLILVFSLLHVFTTFLSICTCCSASIQVIQYAGTLADQPKYLTKWKISPLVSIEAGKWLDTDLFDVLFFYIGFNLHM